jgi:hypothetical protein
MQLSMVNIKGKMLLEEHHIVCDAKGLGSSGAMEMHEAIKNMFIHFSSEKE